MKLPIPNDWDGESWECYQIQWPDSVAYRGLLMGFLSYLARGRTYDEETGSIKAAQLIGWEIFNRNLDLIPCAEAQPPTPPPPIDQWAPECAFDGLGDLFEESEDCMPGVLDIKIENGKLWKRMSPCCEWFEVGSLASISDELPDDPYEDWIDPPDEFSACGAAYAVLDTIYKLVDAVWDAKDDLLWEIIGNVKDRLPGVQLTTSVIWSMIGYARAISMAGLADEDEIFDATTRQQILCKMVSIFADEPAPVTNEQINKIALLLTLEHTFEVGLMFADALPAIGQGDLSNIAKAGAADTEQDCNCPDVIVDPRPMWPVNDWAYWVNIKQHGLPAWATLGGDSVYVSGEGVVDYPGVSGLMNPEIRAALTIGADTTVIYGYLKYRVVWPGTDYQGNYCYCKSLSYAEHVWNGDFTPDTDPSAGGTITHTRVVVLNPTDGLNDWAWALEMNTLNGEDNDRLVYIEEIGLAGTGTDPFV